MQARIRTSEAASTVRDLAPGAAFQPRDVAVPTNRFEPQVVLAIRHALRDPAYETTSERPSYTNTRTNGIWNGDRFRYDPEQRETAYLPGDDEARAQRFRYDADDNVTGETDALGHTLSRVFDAAGFETALTDANGHTVAKVYDLRGNVRRFTDAEGRGTSYGWGRGESSTR